MMFSSERRSRPAVQVARDHWREGELHARSTGSEDAIFEDPNEPDSHGPAHGAASEAGLADAAGGAGCAPFVNGGGDACPANAAEPKPLRATATEAQLTQWITAIGHHDEKALASLYDATAARVHGLVLRIVRKSALAEEVVEETFFQVWRQALRFDASRGAPLAWLLGMARSRAIDGLRREARFQAQSLDQGCMHAVVDTGPATDELLDVARGHAELHRALMLLNAQPRQLVALAFFRGLSHEEIASQTQLPLGTVKSQIRRALMLLRQSLGNRSLPGWAT